MAPARSGGVRRTFAATAGAAIVALVPPAATAQLGVRLSGQIESSVGVETERTAGRTSGALSWGTRYTPTADGFVWHPRFLTYSLGGSFADQRSEDAETATQFRSWEPYRLQLTLFPQASHSFDVSSSRTVSETELSTDTRDVLSTTTQLGHAFGWSYRGSPLLPQTRVSFRRLEVTTAGLDSTAESTVTTLGVRAQKTVGRANPSLGYHVEMRESDTTPRPGSLGEATSESERAHVFEYEDRIRVGDKALLAPSAQYRTGGETRSATGALRLSGPLSTRTDGSAGTRYSFLESVALTTQTVSADGSLTSRLRPDLTVTGGAGGVVVTQADLTWSANGFVNASATPLSHLRTLVDYGLQLTGGRQPAVGHRAHVGASTDWVPRHSLSFDYHVNVVEPEASDTFVGHGITVGATSAAIPLTTVSGAYAVERQEGDGERRGQTGKLEAALTLFGALRIRAAGDVETRSASGGGRAPTAETAWGAESGLDVSLFRWLGLTVSGRRTVRDVVLEDREGQFVSERLAASATVGLRKLTARINASLDREPLVDQTTRTLGASLGYQFRAWTIGLDFSRIDSRFAAREFERQRLFFRLSRPFSMSLAP